MFNIVKFTPKTIKTIKTVGKAAIYGASVTVAAKSGYTVGRFMGLLEGAIEASKIIRKTGEETKYERNKRTYIDYIKNHQNSWEKDI